MRQAHQSIGMELIELLSDVVLLSSYESEEMKHVVVTMVKVLTTLINRAVENIDVVEHTESKVEGTFSSPLKPKSKKIISVTKGKKKNGRKGGKMKLFDRVTKEEAKEIRRLYKNTSLLQKEIGKQFGCTQQTVSEIVRNLTHVDK